MKLNFLILKMSTVENNLTFTFRFYIIAEKRLGRFIYAKCKNQYFGTYQNINVRCVVLYICEYIFPVADDAVKCYRAYDIFEFDRVYLDAETNINGYCDIFVIGNCGFAGICGNGRHRAACKSFGRILFCVAACISSFKLFKGSGYKFQAICTDESFYGNARNLRGGLNFNDDIFGN